MTALIESQEADRQEVHSVPASVLAPFDLMRVDTQAIPVERTRGWIDHMLGFFVVPPHSRRWILAIAPLLALLAGGAAAAVDILIGAAFIGILGLTVLTWNHPPIAGYAMVAAAPVIVGFSRGQVLPLLRPNEALLFALCGILAARWLLYNRRITFQMNRVDFCIGAIVLFGFLSPLLLQLGRLRPVSPEDIFYSLVFVRIALLYALIRHTIRTPGQVRTAIGFSLTAATFLGIIGIMDSGNFFGFAEKLDPYFPSASYQTDDGRGAASIGNPIGFGVYQAINAQLALAMLLGGERPRRILAIPALVCSVAVFGSGQIGPVLSFCVGLAALALVTRSTRRLISWSLPFLIIVSIVAVPLAQRRLTGLEGVAVSSSVREGIARIEGPDAGRALFEANPGSSWDVRIYNLETFFLPEFSDSANLLLGVTPQARVSSPNKGEEFIWIESGHLWLLWGGGVPLFVTWFALIGVGMWTARRVMRTTVGPVGIAAAATFSVLMTVNVAQTFDPHMTLRGTADILYPLLALSVTGFAAKALPRSANQTPAEVVS